MVAKLQIMTAGVVLAIAFIGCSSDDGSNTDNSAAPSSTDSSSEAAAPLDGIYDITVEQSDTTKEAGASPGTWTLTLTMDPASARFSGPGGRSVDLNPTELTETRMVVPPDPSCPNNDPGPGEGEYEVELSGDSLKFTEVEDPCGDRAFTLTVHTWQRVRPGQ